MSNGPNPPITQANIQTLCEALLKCSQKAAAQDPASVKQTLLDLMETQFPAGPNVTPSQDKLGCCTFGQNKLDNWLEADCNAGGGSWTPGPCPQPNPGP